MDNLVEYNDERMENLHEIHINIDETAPQVTPAQSVTGAMPAVPTAVATGSRAELVGATVDNVDIETGDVHAAGENVTG